MSIPLPLSTASSCRTVPRAATCARSRLQVPTPVLVPPGAALAATAGAASTTTVSACAGQLQLHRAGNAAYLLCVLRSKKDELERGCRRKPAERGASCVTAVTDRVLHLSYAVLCCALQGLTGPDEEGVTDTVCQISSMAFKGELFLTWLEVPSIAASRVPCPWTAWCCCCQL
jgi:hypothetical protein